MAVKSRFIQIHKMDSFPAARLNSDESGTAKKIIFGDASRTRIASQAIKRRWRVANDRYALKNIGIPVGYRSRVAVENRITDGLTADSEEGRKVISEMILAFAHGLYGKRADTIRGRQALLLGEPELDFLRSQAERIHSAHSDDAKSAVAEIEKLFAAKGTEGANFRAFRENTQMSAGIEAALFGRMVTSDNAASIESPVHVAHPFTVHGEESELDYFTVVDDLLSENESSSAHINEAELTSGLYYSYVVIDVPGLISNTEGRPSREWESADRNLAAKIVEHLIHLMATVSPGGNKGSTAPYNYSNFILIEVGDRQPRSLADAFRTPVRARTDEAIAALTSHLGTMDNIYGSDEARRFLSIFETSVPRASFLNLSALAEWAAQSVRDGKANYPCATSSST